MTLGLNIAENIARIRGDLRMGVPVVLTTLDGAALIMAAETMGADRWDALIKLGDNLVIAVTTRRAETLRARAYDGDIARLRVPVGADAGWIKAVADPSTDLMSPLKGPFVSERGGNVDVHRAAIALCKQARLLPAAVIAPIPGGAAFARENGLDLLELASAGKALHVSSALNEISAARLPLSVSEAGRLHVFRPDDGGEEHFAVEIGRPDRKKPVLARLHSACFTGDLLGSLKCDCGPQLRAALETIGSAGDGVLLYLSQEGRGIGIANKMRAYALQDQGFDTVEANHRLGFEDDERDFRLGAEILGKLGFSSVRLLTNNPRKVEMMNGAGIKVVERVPLAVGRNAHNSAYLDTKAKKSGHIL